MTSKTVFIIGANRGIGRKFVDKFQSQGWEVHASVRPQTVDDETVAELRCEVTKLYTIDYLDENSIRKAAEQYGSGALDCLVNCAGVSHGPVTWQEYDSAILTTWFQIMVVGPLLATKHFQSNLEQSEAGKVVNLTSRLGSLGENNNGTKIGYKLAKAALNQETRTIAMDLKSKGSKISIMAISPGWVKTKLSGWLGDTDINHSVNGMYATIEKLTLVRLG